MKWSKFTLFLGSLPGWTQEPTVQDQGLDPVQSSHDALPFESRYTPLFELHKQLVEHPSVSGNETDVGLWLAEYLENQNYTVELQEVDPEAGRRNIYAYVGQDRNTKVLLTSHIDTVPPYFPYRVEGERIYGRGAVDAKNCVSAQITALGELLHEGRVSEGEVGLLFVVDEEVAGTGMQYADKYTGVDSWETVIFGEPTELKLGVGHKGIAIAHYKATGKAAHSGYPELGINANEILISALNSVLSHQFPVSDLLGPSTVNIGRIDGGVAANVIPAEARATIAIRVAASVDSVTTYLQDLAEFTEGLELEELYAVAPQYLDYEVSGFDNIVLKYSTDIPNIHGNFTRYLYGSGSIFQAHGANEYVEAADLVESVSGYKQLVLHGLAQSETEAES